jgi:hypothetical protein
LEEDDGRDDLGAVQVEIWARRRTVSSGNLIERSRAEDKKLARDHDVGFMFGSSRRYERRKRGVEVEMNVGMVEVRNVMGSRCAGMR